MTYVLLNKLTAKPGKRDEVVSILLESGKLLESPDCLMYMVSEAVDDPNAIWVTDIWTGKAEHEAALRAPELKPFIQQAMPLLEGMPQQIEVRPIGGLGIPRRAPEPGASSDAP
jgi:quinol monooxygenase YgiN